MPQVDGEPLLALVNSGFGPFIFDRTQYERAVGLMVEQVESN